MSQPENSPSHRAACPFAPFRSVVAPFLGRGGFTWALVALLAAASSGLASAQDRRGRSRRDADLQMRPETLKTRDGLKLRAYYFPSDKGKEAIPVLLVHEWMGQGSPYLRLVNVLRDSGCAVLVLEYRGHGASREQTDMRGRSVTLDPATMRRTDVTAIVNADLEAAKGFLKQENNEGKLNLNALAVIGIEEGAVLAAHWAVNDWRFPSIGNKKQGQDVKALVLISPEKTVKGVAIDPTLRDPYLLRLPIMIVAGADSDEAGEARRIGRQIESMKKRATRGEATGFSLMMAETNLSGHRLVNGSREVIPAIVEFIKGQIPVSDEQNPWIERD